MRGNGEKNDFLSRIASGVITGIILGLLGVSAWRSLSEWNILGLIAAALAAIAFVVLFDYFRNLLDSGAHPKGSQSKIAYDRFRDNLVRGGWPANFYERNLNRFLAATDTFFGDGGDPLYFRVSHAFGMKSPAALWTAPSFNRCALISLASPIAAVLLTWVASGEAGNTGDALGFIKGAHTWQRMGGFLSICFSIFFALSARSAEGFWKPRLRRYSSYFFGLLAIFAISVRQLGTLGLAISLIYFLMIDPPASIAFVFLLSTTYSVGVAFAGHSPWVVAFGIVSVIGFTVAADSLDKLFERSRWRGRFFTLWFALLIAICLVAAGFLSKLTSWNTTGPILLFVVLLPLISAPLNWISLGVTRALIRRGAERGGWWPCAYALADVMVTFLLAAALVVTIVFGIQEFNFMTETERLKPILSLGDTLGGLSSDPLSPGVWWVYMMLLLPFIPTLINLVIGVSSFMQGIPGMSGKIIEYLPLNRPVASIHRNWISLLFTFWWAVSIALAVGILVVLYLILSALLPAIRLNFLDMAEAFVAMDFPGKIYSLFH